MRKVVMSFLILSVFVVPLFAAGSVGVVSSSGFSSRVVDRDDAIRSQSDWYDTKPLVGSVDTQSVINTITKWRTSGTTDTVLAKAIYNSSGTATVIKYATLASPTPAAGDTVRFALSAYGCSPKLPALAKIFKLAATDSLVIFFQLAK